MRNIDDFLKLKDTYIKELPVNKRNYLLSEIENLKKHVEKGCASGIPPGGTESYEKLHRLIDNVLSIIIIAVLSMVNIYFIIYPLASSKVIKGCSV